MDPTIALIVGLVAGGAVVGFVVYLVMRFRNRSAVQEKVAETEARAKTTEGTVIELRNQFNYTGAELEKVRALLDEEGKKRVAAETQLEETRKSLEEQRKLLEEAKVRLTDTFKALSAEALRGNTQEFVQRTDDVLKPLKETLTRYEKALQEMEKTRAGAYQGLATYLEKLEKAHQSLGQQTTRLEQALRAPTVRGRWGEITLERVVELAGLSRYRDFDTQAATDSAESRMRPDLVVRLPGGRSIVVDSKVPLDAYMDAMETDDADVREKKLGAHAAAVRSHIRQLSQKSYWSQFEAAPEFVILFLPGESFFSAALEGDRSLIDDGIKNRVILATPTTLIMALLTVAHSWQQQQLAENAQHIAEAGTALYDRLCVFVRHFTGIRDGLGKAADAYNRAIGSWESRLRPGVEKLRELGAAAPDAELPQLEPSDTSLRELPPAEDAGDGSSPKSE